MSKYILDPSGKIIIDGEVKNPGEASQEILQNQEDYFSSKSPGNNIAVRPSTNALPAGLKGLTEIVDKGVGIVSFETGVKNLENDIFPSKKNSQGNENLLVNPNFGYDKPVKYYSRYNSIFAEGDSNRSIYAEELEMIAGIEFNSAGLFLQTGPNGSKIDISLITYIFDYMIESIVYLSSFWLISGYDNDLKNNLIPDSIKVYFNKLLNFNKDIKGSSFPELVNYFIIGFDKFINTDPKYKSSYQYRDILRFDDPNPLNTSFKFIGRTLAGLSKVGRNRFFLLIRKFQQESYWHSEILFKSKEDSKENLIDKFFIEFNQYYFKFIIERINIGYLFYNSKSQDFTSIIPGSGLDLKNSFSRLFDPSRTFFNEEKDIKERKTKELYNKSIISSEDSDTDYNWNELNVVKKSSFNTSITSLPQLLITNDYFKSRLDKQSSLIHQNFANKKNLKIFENNSKRLPQELVEQVESYLDNEYMPFYLHDLRTNEIVSMHAFLDTISDSFSPEYSSTSGYGRIDDVKHYVKTTRSINLTFSLYAMQSEDFDLMWYQVNKIVSMVYPQWSQGIPANTGKFKDLEDFRFPFTQVPTASPLIRLRVGDVLKSNYSLENLKRLHGNKKKFDRFSQFDRKIKKVVFNKDLLCYHIFSNEKSLGINTLKNLNILNEEIKNLLSLSITLDTKESKEDAEASLKRIKEGNKTTPKYNTSLIDGLEFDVNKQESIIINKNNNSNNIVITKIRNLDNYIESILLDDNRIKGSNKDYLSEIQKNIQTTSIKSKVKNEFYSFIENDLSENFYFFEVKINYKYNDLLKFDFIQYSTFDVIAIPKFIIDEKTINKDYFDTLSKGFELVETGGISESGEIVKKMEKEIDIFSSEDELGNINNPYTKAFESSKGKGLAGFITSLDVNYQESVWNTNSPGSNAPHGVKITMGFSPIHDIAPGLDHEGIMRAPVYNVGSVNKAFFNDN